MGRSHRLTEKNKQWQNISAGFNATPVFVALRGHLGRIGGAGRVQMCRAIVEAFGGKSGVQHADPTMEVRGDVGVAVKA